MSGVDVEEAGMAIMMDVRVVERGMEAERRARREVWRRCGRIVSVCVFWLDRWSCKYEGLDVRCSHPSYSLPPANSALAA